MQDSTWEIAESSWPGQSGEVYGAGYTEVSVITSYAGGTQEPELKRSLGRHHH